MNDSSSNQQLNQIIAGQVDLTGKAKKNNRTSIMVSAKKIKNGFLRTFVEEMKNRNIPHELILNAILELDEEVETKDIDEEKLIQYLSKY